MVNRPITRTHGARIDVIGFLPPAVHVTPATSELNVSLLVRAIGSLGKRLVTDQSVAWQQQFQQEIRSSRRLTVDIRARALLQHEGLTVLPRRKVRSLQSNGSLRGYHEDDASGEAGRTRGQDLRPGRIDHYTSSTSEKRLPSAHEHRR